MEGQQKSVEVILYLISYVEKAHKAHPATETPFLVLVLVQLLSQMPLVVSGHFTKGSGKTHSWNALLTERANWEHAERPGTFSS